MEDTKEIESTENLKIPILEFYSTKKAKLKSPIKPVSGESKIKIPKIPEFYNADANINHNSIPTKSDIPKQPKQDFYKKYSGNSNVTTAPKIVVFSAKSNLSNKVDVLKPIYLKKSRKALFTESPLVDAKPKRKSVHISKAKRKSVDNSKPKTKPVTEIKNEIKKLIENENKQHEAKIKSLENLLLLLDIEDTTDEVDSTPLNSADKENVFSSKKLQLANDMYNSMRVDFCMLETPRSILEKPKSKLNVTKKSVLSKTLQQQCLLLCETPK